MPRATSAPGSKVRTAVVNAPILSSPVRSVRPAARAADASSSRASTDSVLAARSAPAGVRTTPRPARRSSGTPASRSRAVSCCDTADGVYENACATAAIVPSRDSSLSKRSLRTSSIRTA